MNSIRNVAIIHPWMPQYRTAFFQELMSQLAGQNINLNVFYGETPPEWAARNDSNTPDGMMCLPTRFFKVGSRVLVYKSVADVKRAGPFDLLVLEQAVRNLETYQLALDRRVYDRLAYWGHGRTYTKSKSSLEESVKTKVTLRSSWFFGYTSGGVDRMVSQGFPKSRTTIVQNSIDSRQFERDLAGVTNEAVVAFRRRYGLTADTCLFVGGIDESKRIDFLIESCRLIYASNPNFRLVVVGAGDKLDAIKGMARSLPWLVPLGPLFGVDKAVAFRSAKLLLNPGRVGLIAVDSLTSGVPIVTTDWPLHAPEFEYLVDGRTAIVAKDSAAEYSDEVIELLTDDSLVHELSAECLLNAHEYSVESMASRFQAGILSVLGL